VAWFKRESGMILAREWHDSSKRVAWFKREKCPMSKRERASRLFNLFMSAPKVFRFFTETFKYLLKLKHLNFPTLITASARFQGWENGATLVQGPMKTGERWWQKRFCLYAKHLARLRKTPFAYTQNLLAWTQKQTAFFRVVFPNMRAVERSL